MKTNLFFLLIIAIVFTACGEDDGPSTGVYDREAMLTHYANELVLPAYSDLDASVTVLESDILAFIADPQSASLEKARRQYWAALQVWQTANAYNFGPAGEAGLNKGLIEEIGTFPVNTDKVDAFIAGNDTSLANFDRDTRGFYTIGYLLHGEPNAGMDVLAAVRQPWYQAYLRTVVRNLRERVSVVLDEWNGSYKADFISRSGTDVGSGTSELYNEFVRSFESVKNFKVGLVAGMRPGQTGPEPTLVESRFAGVSKELIGDHLEAIKRIYTGQRSDGVEGPGLQDYVEAVEGGPALVASTLEQWEKVMNAYDVLPQNKTLQELAAEDAAELQAFHTELQKHTRFFKSDMSSVLGIAITFASGDGD
jgi:predicted lipoprotein